MRDVVVRAQKGTLFWSLEDGERLWQLAMPGNPIPEFLIWRFLEMPPASHEAKLIQSVQQRFVTDDIVCFLDINGNYMYNAKPLVFRFCYRFWDQKSSLGAWATFTKNKLEWMEPAYGNCPLMSEVDFIYDCTNNGRYGNAMVVFSNVGVLFFLYMKRHLLVHSNINLGFVSSAE